MDEEYLNYGLGEQPAGAEIQLPEQVQAVNPEDQQYYVGNKGGSSSRNPYLSKLYGNIGQKQYDTLTNRAKYIYIKDLLMQDYPLNRLQEYQVICGQNLL